jgi:hypothetical protein
MTSARLLHSQHGGQGDLSRQHFIEIWVCDQLTSVRECVNASITNMAVQGTKQGTGQENLLGIRGELTTYRVWRALAVCLAGVVLHFWGSNSDFDFVLLVPAWMDFVSYGFI